MQQQGLDLDVEQYFQNFEDSGPSAESDESWRETPVRAGGRRRGRGAGKVTSPTQQLKGSAAEE